VLRVVRGQSDSYTAAVVSEVTFLPRRDDDLRAGARVT
jgi:hypothetical protein